MNVRLLVAALVVLAVVVPTAAVTVAGSDDTVDVGDAEVSIAPHEGPNGAYAAVDGGELEVDFQRLNDGARTAADDVFTITASGDVPAVVWVTVEAEGVAVYRGGDPAENLDGEDDAVRLAPGETIAVGVEVDASEQVPDSATVTVHARAGGGQPSGSNPGDGSGGDAEFEVTDLSAPAEVTAGGSATIAATVENVGDADGEYVAKLVVDGTVVARQAVSVPAGETRTVTFDRTFDRPGTYELAVGDRQRSIAVVRPTKPAASFRVSDPRIVDQEVRVGERAQVAVTVENVGDADGETTVELVVGGTVVDRKTVSLAAGETRTVTFNRTFQQAGVYAVGVGGLDAGEVTVLSGAEADGRTLSSSLQTAAAGPVVVLLLLLLAWRRW